MIETEVKLRLNAPGFYTRSPEIVQDRLLNQLDFKVDKQISQQHNILFDTKDNSLAKNGQIIRLRTIQDNTDLLLTFKGKNTGKEMLEREERETKVGAEMFGILEALGYNEVFRYIRTCTVFRHRNHNIGGEVVIDTVRREYGAPCLFLEIEGWEPWVHHMAETLVFSKADYINKSYRELLSEV